MIDGIKEIIELIDNPLLGTAVVILVLGFTFYKYFQLIKRENFSLHKDRIDLVEKFIKVFSSADRNDRILVEELFQALWGVSRVRYDEIVFLMNLNSPKYLILLYIKAKGFVEIDGGQIKVQKKYGRHESGLVKEENKIKWSYYFFTVVFSISLSTSMFINRPDSISDFLILLLFLLICIIGILFALLEVVKVYAAQRIIDEWKK